MRVELKVDDAGEYLVTFLDTPATARMLARLLRLPAQPGWPDSIVVTAGTNGVHGPNSKHPKGLALDLRAKTFPFGTREAFRRDYEAFLGPQFRVLHEAIDTPEEHFHVQVKKGRTFDPAKP